MQCIVHANAISDTANLYYVFLRHSQQISTRIMGECTGMLIKTMVCHPLGKNRWRRIDRNSWCLNVWIYKWTEESWKYSKETYWIFVFSSSWWQTVRIDSLDIRIWRRNAVNANRMRWIWIENGILVFSYLNRRTWHHWRCCTDCRYAWSDATRSDASPEIKSVNGLHNLDVVSSYQL